MLAIAVEDRVGERVLFCVHNGVYCDMSTSQPARSDEPAPPSQVPGRNFPLGATSRLASWKLWIPLLLVSLGMIAVVLMIPAYRRLKALEYLEADNIPYSISPEYEWITEWFGEGARGFRRVELIGDNRADYDFGIRHGRLILTDDFLRRVVALNEAEFPYDTVFDGSDAGLQLLSRFPRANQFWLGPNNTATDEALADYLQHGGAFEIVNLYGSAAATETVESLSRIESIRRLILSRTQISDIDCAAIARMQNLEETNLSETAITDEGLRHLSHSQSISAIHIANCSGVTDVGIAHLIILPELRELHLQGTSITAACTRSLAQMPQLEVCYVYNTPMEQTYMESDLSRHPPHDWHNQLMLLEAETQSLLNHLP